MNKKSKIILMLLIILVSIIGIFVVIKDRKDINQDNYSNTTNIKNESNENITTQYEIKELGTIECEKIGLNAPIKETVELDVLSTAVGHFEDTALYNGNVCLAGHNSGTNKNGEDIGFFKRLNELEIGDEIKMIMEDDIASRVKPNHGLYKKGTNPAANNPNNSKKIARITYVIII